MTNGPETTHLLELVDTLLVNVRHGADSRVLLYAWRKAGGDDASFQQAIGSLLSAGLIALVNRPDRPLRLTRDGFEALREAAERLPNDEPSPADEEPQWEQPVGGQTRPLAERVAVLLQILAVLRPPVDHPLSATSMRRLWQIEGMRAGDLRDALDALAERGTLHLSRGNEGTDILLTERGAGEIEALAAPQTR